MSVPETIILGIIQGLTEFLPVSSSGHLVIFQRFLGVEEPGITLEVFLHLATLLSVFWVFRRDFAALLSFRRDKTQRRFLILLIMGTIPTGIIGLLGKPLIHDAYRSTLLTGCMLLVTGTLLWIINSFKAGAKTIDTMSSRDALVVGVMQGLAILPGISRSGATITGALWTGLDRATAVRYSFMLSAPAIFGAALLEMKDMLETGVETGILWNYLAGGFFAFVCGVLAIRVFIRLLQNKKFNYFSYYCFIAGIITIILSLIIL